MSLDALLNFDLSPVLRAISNDLEGRCETEARCAFERLCQEPHRSANLSDAMKLFIVRRANLSGAVSSFLKPGTHPPVRSRLAAVSERVQRIEGELALIEAELIVVSIEVLEKAPGSEDMLLMLDRARGALRTLNGSLEDASTVIGSAGPGRQPSPEKAARELLAILLARTFIHADFSVLDYRFFEILRAMLDACSPGQEVFEIPAERDLRKFLKENSFEII
ncbi:hypothetical protein SAMN05421853_11019 [Roseivivax halotolerans]|uniref:Uncharacterized protein n=1 Tax=Roseivivax halotolerans TaxID=93684 RepID=A0A1I5ZHA1_9RHOB|nr:hypothetical protein [Roseivivax halotolerans]SFQ55733.1 hypothetical protein SAMN05421853_11019 [Roseivivax halotolerans]